MAIYLFCLLLVVSNTFGEQNGTDVKAGEDDYFNLENAFFDPFHNSSEATDVPETEDTEGINLALRRNSSQSSTYNHLAAAENAVDGHRSTNYMTGHCTHTDLEVNPWWSVDLSIVYKVTTVKITNRGDCCSKRINGAEIRIGLSSEHGGTKNPKCATISSLGRGKEGVYECGMVGRYLTINIPDRAEHLTLCEVKVYGHEVSGINASEDEEFNLEDAFDPFHNSSDATDVPETEDTEGINLAFRGISSQSSKYDRLGAAENAIDGHSSANYLTAHCSHTDLDIEPWWSVDLTNVYNVTTVKITNREDCCSERINGAVIRIGLSSENGGTKNPKCATISSLGLGEEGVYECGMVGRYLTITIPNKAAYLTLCEVKAYGYEVSGINATTITEDSEEHSETIELQNILKHSNFATNVALQGVASQSSIDGGDPGNAIDGSLKNIVAAHQCAKTEEELDPWWTLDLKSDHKIFSIAVTSGADCCNQDLDGAEIHIGVSATGWKKNPICGTISSIGLGETVSFHCGGMEGRFVMIVAAGKTRSLTICEVQVFGVSTDTPTGDSWNGDLELQKQHHGAKNVAPQGIPSQSSYFGWRREAKSAIDGSLASNYMAGHCTHTRKEPNPWWRVDLKARMIVQSVAITNRNDCCRERINGAEVHIGNSKENGGINNTRCGVVFRMNYGETISFNCNGMEGQYITLTLPNTEFLSICEVQVFAHPTETQDPEPITHSDPEPIIHSDSDEIWDFSPKPDPSSDLHGKAFFFPEQSDNSYIYLSPQKPMNLRAFTLCMKLSLNVPENRETILFSYRTLDYDELNLWIEFNGKIGLYMSGEGVYFPPIHQAREWNHLCLTWESKYGRTELWVNARRKPLKVYRRRHRIRQGGIAMFGQDQDFLGDGFDADQSYIGKIKDLNMWDRVLSLKAIRNLYREKEVEKGNIFDWGSLTYTIQGNVTTV